MRCTPCVIAAEPDATSVWMGCSASAPWLPTAQTTTARETVPCSEASWSLPFGMSLMPRRSHEKKGKASGLVRWVVRSWASWAVPSGRGRSSRAGQILPVFVIAALFTPRPARGSCRSGRERGARAFPPFSYSYSYSTPYSIYPRRPKGSAQERTQISEDKTFFHTPPSLCSTQHVDVTVPGWSGRAQARRGSFVRCDAVVCRSFRAEDAYGN